MSSLASQLANLGNSHGTTIVDKKKRKALHSVSLVYETSVAATQDYETILEASLEGLRDLETLDSRFSVFKRSLFSETSISIDRNVQTSEQNELLDKAVNNFLSLVARYINLQPAIKALEWLIRRFQIHQFNGEQLLLTILPYYSTPIFLRVLDIMPSALPALFSFLSNSRKHIQNPSRNLIIRALSNDSQLLDLVNSHVQQQVSDLRDYHHLLAFWSSFSIWTMISLKEQRVNEDDIVNKWLSTVSYAITFRKSPDAQIAGYMILTVLSTQFDLSTQVREAAISSIAQNWSKASSKNGFSCITQLIEGSDQEDLSFLINKTSFAAFEKMKHLDADLVSLAEKFQVEKFTVAWASAVFEYKVEDIKTVSKVLNSIQMSTKNLSALVSKSLKITFSGNNSQETKSQLTEFYELLLAKGDYSDAISISLESHGASFDNLELALQTSLKGRPLNNEADDVAMDDAEVEENKAAWGISSTPSSLETSSVDSFLAKDSNADFSARLSLFLQSLNQRRKHSLSLTKLKTGSEPSFWARIWTSSLPTLAKIHALEQFESSLEPKVDYQAFIPCFLVALYDESDKVRRAAGSIMQKLSEATKPSKAWGMDFVYGPGEISGDVKWLTEKEEKKFLADVICSRLAECYLDSNYILRLFESIKHNKDLKSLNATLVAFLGSHCLAVKLPGIKSVLLKAIVQLDSKYSSKTLAPLLDSFLSEYTAWEATCKNENFLFHDLEADVINIVNSSDKAGLVFLQDCISSKHHSLAVLAGAKIVDIWPLIKPDSQLFLLRFLSEASVNDNFIYDTMTVLNSVNISSAHFAILLDDSKLEREGVNGDAAAASVGNVAKRRRRSSASSRQQLQTGVLADFAERHLKKLTGILELLEKSNEDHSTKLLSQLFVILGEILSLGIDSKLPILYTQQVLANCMIEVVNKLKAQNTRSLKIDSNLVRVDIVVSCIRSCPSPQVQNRFLLLVANLAGLAPEIVLHSVMPIFTFMGANTLRQDDEFSAHAIQQTIAQVIPALMSGGQSSEEIDFLLLSFAATFVHIPRHRRLKLFTTLIRTLGIDESLYKLLLLLGQKYSEAKTKRRIGEAKTFIQFAKTFARSFDVSQQVTALEKYLAEIADLFSADENLNQDRSQLHAALLNNNDSSKSEQPKADLYNFLEQVIDDEKIPGTQSLRLSFLVLSKNNKSQGAYVVEVCQKILEHLIAESGLDSGKMQVDNDDADTKADAFSLLSKVLEILPITDFTRIMAGLKGDAELVRETVQLVSTKFSYELSNDNDAQESAWVVIDAISQYLLEYQELSQYLLDALDFLITKYGTAGKNNAKLLEIVDIVSGSAGLNSENADSFVAAVACSNSIFNILGAVAIGKFPKVVPVAIEKFEAAVSNDDEESTSIQLAVLALMGGLLKRIPAFITSTLPKIMELIFISNVGAGHRQRLVNIVVDTVDPVLIISALSKTWKFALQGGVPGMLLFLDTLDTVVDLSSKKQTTQSSETLISIVLEVFELRKLANYGVNEINRIESKAIASTLQIVMKLNDKTFRPLFVRMVKWAIDDQDQSRMIVFFKFFVSVLNNLKGIVTNYYGYVLDAVCNLLERVAQEEPVAESLKRSLLSSLVASFQYDRDEFWQAQARFDKICACLIDLIPTIQTSLGGVLVKAIVGLAEAGGSPDLYKVINEGVSVHLKADCGVSEKIWAVRSIKGLYTRLGEEWVSMLPQLVPLIAELLEDDDESVELEVRRNLVPVVEEVLGESLDRYLS